MFKLEIIDTSNAAFEDGRSAEVARILRNTANRLGQGQTAGNLHDANGNPVGQWYLEDSDEYLEGSDE